MDLALGKPKPKRQYERKADVHSEAHLVALSCSNPPAGQSRWSLRLLAGRRLVEVTQRRTRTDWALFLRDLAAQYPNTERVTLVMDNLNTHGPG